MSRYVTVRLRRDRAGAMVESLAAARLAYDDAELRELREALGAALRSPPRRPRKQEEFAPCGSCEHCLQGDTRNCVRPSEVSPLQRMQRNLRAAKEAKKAARASKREETARIWEECWERADGMCECGCGGNVWRSDDPEGVPAAVATLDHFWGRAKRAQSVENCWILRSDCHWAKTREAPDKETWIRRFRAFAMAHGYAEQVAECDKYLEGKILMANLWKKRRAARRVVRKAASVATPRELCRSEDLHTPCPTGYLEWHEWAEEMDKTHTQKECPGRGLWAIWKPKGAAP